jgi:hypothetical protein
VTDPGGVLLDREQLERAFTALGDRLVRRGVVADVFIVGGAAMALAYDATRCTQSLSRRVLAWLAQRSESQTFADTSAKPVRR